MATGAGLTMTNVDRNVGTREVLEQKSQAVLKRMEQHDEFLRKLPNYDGLGLWLDSKSYEDWMIKDINQKYRQGQ